MKKSANEIAALRWGGDRLYMLDQRLLPGEETWLELRTAAEVADAIRDMAVRGAPAIGIAAAYGVALGAIQPAGLDADMALLEEARPTAVNLRWALERMRRRLETDGPEALSAEAEAIHREDIEQNLAMGKLGAALIDRPARIMTHCNTGALATGGHGTALGVIRTGFADGKIEAVFATETRPWLQGSRLTAWELAHEGIPATLIADSAAASVMARGRIDWVIVGADRIAANGDTANKIGTYSLAVLARQHGARFMVVAPTSTVDFEIATGGEIPIEERNPRELWRVASSGELPTGLNVYNPVFDVTPAALIDALVTERGVVTNPSTEKMRSTLQSRPAPGEKQSPIVVK
ncbi:MAG TPA: S-methyl-5-thioribose-1-phosphate isomerase [Gammaproteobacteria bacterium]|nr:S-methyl-5-thioribose-1-phosphate isomerase [Gammaproteobacteria bacterium]